MLFVIPAFLPVVSAVLAYAHAYRYHGLTKEQAMRSAWSVFWIYAGAGVTGAWLLRIFSN